MQELNDTDLLREYVARGSNEAFATLVTRHVNKVYSVALRHTGNQAQAEEITQAVFVILARKSSRLGRRVILSGWLYQTARLTAMTFIRSEIRRARREQEVQMQNVLNENEADLWAQIAPLLDEAMAGLNETDRRALVLRFFDDKTMSEVGTALGANTDAAEKRVSRALEKLRKYFSKRGVTSTAETIAGTIAAHSVQAAPVWLAKTATAVALAKGATASTSTLTLIKGALKIMARTKAKTVVVAGIVVLLAAGTTVVTIHIHQAKRTNFNANDFWATSYPNGFWNPSIGHPLNWSFRPAQSKTHLCSISGLLNECMQVSGWQYLIDKNVAAGTVEFSISKPLNGEEWVAAFEDALQNGNPQWFDFITKKFRRENLVLIRYPDQKIVLVLPPEKAGRYQNLAAETTKALVKQFEPPPPGTISPEAAFLQESTNHLNQAIQWGMAWRIFAQEHNNRLPESLAQLKDYGGGILDTNWEMVSGGDWGSIRNPSATILLREKESRHGPDGTFIKAYTFADGRAQLETSSDGDFTTLEQQRGFLIHPAEN